MTRTLQRVTYTALAGGRDIEPEIIDAISEGVANMADILADEFGFNKDEYMDWTGVNVGAPTWAL